MSGLRVSGGEVSRSGIDATIAAHAAASDPHGDRAFATAQDVSPHAYADKIAGLLAAGSGAYQWKMLDLFKTDRATGAVNNTLAEPGGIGTHAQNTRVVVDATSKLSLSGGVASFAAGGLNDPSLRYGTFTRVAGMVLCARCKNTTFVNGNQVGIDENTTGSGFQALSFRATTILRYVGPDNIQIGGALSLATDYDVTIVLRATGAFFFIRGGVYTYPTLVWVSDLYNTSPVYLTIYGNDQAQSVSLAGALETLWLPVPLVSDSFNRADGAIGSTDGAGNPEANGGRSLAWTDQIGTWATATNVATATLDGGLALATAPSGKSDVIHDVKVTRTGGAAGSVVRYADASNYVIAYHDGTNVKLDKVVGGTTTAVLSVASAYSAGATLRVVTQGTAFDVYYNNLRIGTGTISDAALQTGTAHGLYTTDAGNSLNDCVTWARGSGGEYNALRSFFPL